MLKGQIYNIQHYSLHDGPGIRTTIFMKGCPLKCWWCHNPESINSYPDLMIRDEKCIKCYLCKKACSVDAVSIKDNRIKIEKSKCELCLSCVDACPVEAIELFGREILADEVFDEIIKDRVFHEESGGGVTFSGGEPLMQPDFLKKLLLMCKAEDIHTAVDTSGYAKWEYIEAIADFTDLFLFDLKFFNEEKHKKYTGVSNKLIFQNLEKLSKIHSNIVIRIPIIPSINDDIDNISKIGKYIYDLALKDFSLIPYHNMGKDKYKGLGLNYKLTNIQKPDKEKMKRIKDILGGLFI